ncbi:MAG: methionyl aminopeptidase, partial [Patescibacteria group bacterium]|nr:methionyl aminopeptidase [Patescibacteria group bacterium]
RSSDLAEKLRTLGGKPAFLGYYGFPDVICISLNDEVVHGIPDPKRIVKDGDILSLDFGVSIDGMITDSAISVVVGTTINNKVQNLLRTTQESMLAGIETLHDGVQVGTISNAIETVLKKQRLGIVRDLVGHGVGHELHEEPNIPNYGKRQTGMVLKEGMTIAIEPMATLGTDSVHTAGDDWTIRTNDGSLSAHFEHTILITKDGYEILTIM